MDGVKYIIQNGKAYISNITNNQLYVVNTSNNNIFDSISVSSNPISMKEDSREILGFMSRRYIK